MSARYQVVVIHKDMEGLRSEVVSSVREAVTGILHNADLLTFPRLIEDVDDRSQVAVIYLGSRAGATDRGIHGQLEAALRHHFPVLPVVHGSDPGQVEAKLPLVISALHAEDWASEESKITRHLATMLGLAERERRLFVSYVQRDSAEMALQITDSLNRSQFDVFLPALFMKWSCGRDLWRLGGGEARTVREWGPIRREWGQFGSMGRAERDLRRRSWPVGAHLDARGRRGDPGSSNRRAVGSRFFVASRPGPATGTAAGRPAPSAARSGPRSSSRAGPTR